MMAIGALPHGGISSLSLAPSLMLAINPEQLVADFISYTIAYHIFGPGEAKYTDIIISSRG
jgi:hypothetical protein